MEEKLFECKTKILEKENKELNKVIFILRIVPMILIYEVMALFFVFYGIFTNKLLIAIIFGIIMLVFPLLMIFISSYRTKKIYQKYQEIYQNSLYTYSFYEEGVKVVLNYQKTNNDAYFKYQDIKIIETNESIYLFVSSSNAYVVCINGFSENFDRLGFRSVVQGKVKKYKIMRKI